ncbi:hypothetical protein [Paracidovorax oryzae]|uniref:hypothetical protein n=1 Tax=Paracidovorax oryzae TaxID=862720 RepID=UPI0002EDC831|nr:hypothetical protein [Paracidovorax oryzae]
MKSMNQESLENAIAAVLRAAHVGDTTGDEDDATARGTAGVEGWHGSLRDALAAVIAAWPQASGWPSIRDVEVAQVTAVVFREPAPPWAVRTGELRISEVRTIPKDGQGSARAVATGSYRLDMAPDGAGAGVPSCTVRGTFEGAIFRLKAGTD